MKILLVEDDRRMSNALADVLRGEAYAVDPAYDGREASELAATNSYDLVILDLTIPPPTGLELLKEWRKNGDPPPVLVLTALGSLADRITGLDAGADDYLTKPFSFAELLARARSLLRRRAKPLLPELQAGDLTMDRAARRVTLKDQAIHLSLKEFALLELLLTRKDEIVTRQQISEHVWDSSFDSMTNVVNVFVYRVRKKIDGQRQHRLLHTIQGKGYILRSERCLS